MLNQSNFPCVSYWWSWQNLFLFWIKAKLWIIFHYSGIKLLKYYWVSCMILLPSGFQWANFTEDSRGQVCQEGAACVSRCELGHQTDAVVTHHHDWILKPRHACCLPGCAADSQKQGMTCVIEWRVKNCLFPVRCLNQYLEGLGFLIPYFFSFCRGSCRCWLTECCWHRQRLALRVQRLCHCYWNGPGTQLLESCPKTNR